MPFYPPFDEKALWALDVIRQNMEQDPNYLQNSPYLPKSQIELKKLIRPKVEMSSEKGRTKYETLEIETRNLYKDLKSTSEGLSIEDHSERMSYFRTAASLLDKLVGLEERAMGLRRIHKFQQLILGIMEDTLDPGQRTQVMDQLRKSMTEDS